MMYILILLKVIAICKFCGSIYKQKKLLYLKRTFNYFTQYYFIYQARSEKLIKRLALKAKNVELNT